MSGSWKMYLIAASLGILGLWLIQLGLSTKPMKQKMQESMTPRLKWVNDKERALRVYFGIGLLIASLIIFLRS